MVGRELHNSVTILTRWSRTKGWVERARAWDEERSRADEEGPDSPAALAFRELQGLSLKTLLELMPKAATAYAQRVKV